MLLCPSRPNDKKRTQCRTVFKCFKRQSHLPSASTFLISSYCTTARMTKIGSYRVLVFKLFDGVCRSRRHNLFLRMDHTVRPHDRCSFDPFSRSLQCVRSRECTLCLVFFDVGTTHIFEMVPPHSAVMHDVGAFSHLHAEQMTLEVDAPRLLRSTAEHLQA